MRSFLALLLFNVAVAVGQDCHVVRGWSFPAQGGALLDIHGIKFKSKVANSGDFTINVHGSFGKRSCLVVKRGQLKPHADGYIYAYCDKYPVDGQYASISTEGLTVCGGTINLIGSIKAKSAPGGTAHDCRKDAYGLGYRGTQSKTKYGLTCKRWDATTMGKRLDEDSRATNHCRNPDNHAHGPWCYTMDPSKRWQTCGIPYCVTTTCRNDALGLGYRGTKSQTKYGLTCKRWDATTMGKRLDKDSRATNHCRNPDNHAHGPWCYTMDPSKRWQTCGIPYCVTTTCRNDALGLGYRGTKSQTKYGLTCKRWDATTMGKRLDEDSRATNHCRNPDNHAHGPWCYTMDPSKRWQTCGIPYCG